MKPRGKVRLQKTLAENRRAARGEMQRIRISLWENTLDIEARSKPQNHADLQDISPGNYTLIERLGAALHLSLAPSIESYQQFRVRPLGRHEGIKNTGNCWLVVDGRLLRTQFSLRFEEISASDSGEWAIMLCGQFHEASIVQDVVLRKSKRPPGRRAKDRQGCLGRIALK